MKRIAIISLLAVFLTTNYAYATITTEEVAQKIEQTQYQKLAQQVFEELLFEYMINYMSLIETQQITPDDVVNDIIMVLVSFFIHVLLVFIIYLMFQAQ